MILITGAKGFIGKRLVERLEKELPGITRGIDLKDGQNLLTCPLPDDFNLECIYHLAAQTSVEASWKDPVHDMDNLRLTARLIKRYPYTKIIYANSCAAVNPKSPYGFSKKASGDYIKNFHNNYVNLIFPNIYGDGSKSVVDIFKGKDEVTIYGDGLQTRDFVHIDDIVRGLVKAKDWAVGEYFMGSEKSTSVLELAKGKKITFAKARKEEREVVVPNTTPNWEPIISVLQYI